jgi:alkylation response protein AidB-like acyl-CoA dehydrogenase
VSGLVERPSAAVPGTLMSWRTLEPDSFSRRLREVCEEVIGPHAASVDREARHPTQSWDALWEIGAFSMRLPNELGGGDVGVARYISVIQFVAGYCASSAMTLHMHCSACDVIRTLGSPGQVDKYLAPLVANRTLLASWASEPNVSLSVRYLTDTIIDPRGDGFVVNGFKHFCTMANAADYALVWGMTRPQQDDPPRDVIAIVPRQADGVTVAGEWYPLGMRGTVSPSVGFRDSWVDRDALIYGALESAVVPQLALGFAAVLVGIAMGAFDATSEYLGKKVLAGESEPVAASPAVQRRFGELAAVLHAGGLAVADAAARWEAATLLERTVLTASAKFAAARAALDVTREAMELVGGASAMPVLGFERAYRDARTASLMPPNFERVSTTLGRDALNLGTPVFDAPLGSGGHG